MSALSGRVAVVTGADQPLGRGLALAVAADGAAVALLGDAAAITPLVQDVRDRDGQAIALDVSLTQRDDVERAVS